LRGKRSNRRISGGVHTPTAPVGRGDRGVMAVNSDDDDLDGTEDRFQPGPVTGEDDLTQITPIPGCCPCASHNGDVDTVTLVSCPDGVKLYAAAQKTAPFPVYQGIRGAVAEPAAPPPLFRGWKRGCPPSRK
jgi:hypothetical protein